MFFGYSISIQSEYTERSTSPKISYHLGYVVPYQEEFFLYDILPQQAKLSEKYHGTLRLNPTIKVLIFIFEISRSTLWYFY